MISGCTVHIALLGNSKQRPLHAGQVLGKFIIATFWARQSDARRWSRYASSNQTATVVRDNADFPKTPTTTPLEQVPCSTLALFNLNNFIKITFYINFYYVWFFKCLLIHLFKNITTYCFK